MTVYAYGCILDVDLSSGRIVKKGISSDFARNYIGGMAFGCKILYDEVRPGTDPLGPDNIVVFSNGPLTGTRTPCSGRTEITTRSPLSGHIGSGNTGGVWGAALKHAGVDVLIVRGCAPKPVYLWIDDDTVEIRDATHLWGRSTITTTDVLSLKSEGMKAPRISVMTIGPGGENLVRFACPVNDYHHVAGRSGAGAVMGSKRLKAVAVRGTKRVPIARPEKFTQIATEARKRLTAASDAAMRGGAPPDIRVEDAEKGCLPAKNFQTGVLPGWLETRTAAAARKYIDREEGTCYRCPVSCFKIAEVKEGKHAGAIAARGQMPGVAFNFGALCAIDNLPAIWHCKHLCQEMGLDYESTGAVMAFAMELFQRKVIDTNDTGGLDLEWGNEEAALRLVEMISHRQGFGDILAEGAVRAAEIIGRDARESVLEIKGMELTMMPDPRPATRPGWLFGALTNPRGGDNVKNTHFYAERHNPNWGAENYDMFDEVRKEIYKSPPEKQPDIWEGKALMCRWFEDLFSVCNAFGICFFTVGNKLAWGPYWLSRLISAATGWDIGPADIVKMGEKAFTLLKAYTIREGYSRKDDRWPERFYTVPLPEGPAKGAVLSREVIDAELEKYYDLRGWDRETGLPSAEKLTSIGLGDMAKELLEAGLIKPK